MDSNTFDRLTPFTRKFTSGFEYNIQLEENLLQSVLKIKDKKAITAAMIFYTHIDYRPINDLIRGMAYLYSEKNIIDELLFQFNSFLNSSKNEEKKLLKGILACLFFSKYCGEIDDRLKKIKLDNPKQPTSLEEKIQQELDGLICAVEDIWKSKKFKIDPTQEAIVSYFLEAIIMIGSDKKLSYLATEAISLYISYYDGVDTYVKDCA